MKKLIYLTEGDLDTLKVLKSYFPYLKSDSEIYRFALIKMLNDVEERKVVQEPWAVKKL